LKKPQFSPQKANQHFKTAATTPQVPIINQEKQAKPSMVPFQIKMARVMLVFLKM